MFSLLDRIPNGVDPMLKDIEAYIIQSGIDGMKASAEIITTVSGTHIHTNYISMHANIIPTPHTHTHTHSLSLGFREIRRRIAFLVQSV